MQSYGLKMAGIFITGVSITIVKMVGTMKIKVVFISRPILNLEKYNESEFPICVHAEDCPSQERLSKNY